MLKEKLQQMHADGEETILLRYTNNKVDYSMARVMFRS